MASNTLAAPVDARTASDPTLQIVGPGDVLEMAASEKTGAWQKVVDVLAANYENPDVDAARVLFSVVAAHALKDYPSAWALAIAPPGSAKTDILESLRDLPRVYFIDEVTPRTFLSGKLDERNRKRKKPASLLHRIGPDGILIAADFSTYTADPKTLKAILAQLRRIYDGNFSREFGTDEHLEEREWHGRLTVVAGAVPDVDRQHGLFQSLGERFIRVRWPRAGGVDSGLRAMEHTYQLSQELKAAVHGLLLPVLESEHTVVPSVTSEMLGRIASLTELAVLGRSYIERDHFRREIEGIPVTEGNTRLPQQLLQLARGSALLDGRDSVNEDDYSLVIRAAFDSMPPARQRVLISLIRGRGPYTLDLAPSVVYRALDDLQAVKVVQGVGENRGSISLTDSALDLIRRAGLNGRLTFPQVEDV